MKSVLGWLIGRKKEQAPTPPVIDLEEDSEKSVDFVNSMSNIEQWQRGFINGYSWAQQKKFHANFKFVKILTQLDKKRAEKGLANIREQMIVSNVSSTASTIPVCTLLSGVNLQGIINDCIENAEQHGWCLTDKECNRFSDVVKTHIVPEIGRFLNTYSKGESISIRIIYRPPMKVMNVAKAPPTLIVSICDGCADERGNPPAETSDIYWSSAIFKKMKATAAPKSEEKQTKDSGDGDDLIEMK